MVSTYGMIIIPKVLLTELAGFSLHTFLKLLYKAEFLEQIQLRITTWEVVELHNYVLTI